MSRARGSGRLLGGGFLGGGLLRRGLFGGRLLGGALAGRGRALGAALGQQLSGALDGDLLDRVAPAQRRVGLAVGDVRAEPAFLDHHGLVRRRVVAQLPQRRGGGRPATPGLGLREQGQRLVEGHSEELLLVLEGARVVALGQVRSVAARPGQDLDAVLRGADDPGERQQPQRVLQRQRVDRLRLEQRRRLLAALHVRAVAAGLDHDRLAGLRILAEFAFAAALLEQLLDLVGGQFVRGDVLRQRCARALAPVAALQVRAEPADAYHHGAVRGVEQRDRVDATGVDLGELLGDQLLQPAGPRDAALHAGGAAEVEGTQEVRSRLVAGGDRVQLVLHRGGEGVIHQAAEVLLHQPHHGERQERRDQRLAALEHVPPVLDGLHDRRVRGRTADAELFQGLDQRRLGVAGRRLGGVADRLEPLLGQLLVLDQPGQPALAVVRLGRLVVGGLHVRLQEPGIGDGLAGGGEVAGLARGGDGLDPYRDRVADRVGHLAGDRTAPDQLVQPELLAGQLVRDLARCAEAVARRADRLVRLLRVLHLALVATRFRGYVAVAVQLAYLLPGGGERRLGQVGRDPHGLRGRQPQLARRLLLQRAGDERRIRLSPVRLLLDPGDPERYVVQPRRQAPSALLVQVHHPGARPHLTGGRVEVLARRHPVPVERDQVRGKAAARFALRLHLDPVAGR